MIELNDVQWQSVKQASDPPRIVDPATGTVIVLLKSADFDWIRELLKDEPDAPRITNPRTQEAYALVPCQRYERFKAFFEEDPLTPAERRAISRIAGERAGWKDPAFDVYDESSSAEIR